MELEFKRKEELSYDILDNLSDDCQAILKVKNSDADYWIEIVDSENGKFFVPDGLTGIFTNNLNEAEAYLLKFIIDNS